ncbi:hypothetical protein E2C01_048942 [Portunus trituberculatus]|uniref:Uncharacterized protein n=1 Tax=Portunus trituberculatus TaxID=210409 RepID=A0A5B7G4Z3_PORTR|nr:hypothetical protein [Portunus trituberculatus]
MGRKVRLSELDFHIYIQSRSRPSIPRSFCELTRSTASYKAVSEAAAAARAALTKREAQFTARRGPDDPFRIWSDILYGPTPSLRHASISPRKRKRDSITQESKEAFPENGGKYKPNKSPGRRPERLKYIHETTLLFPVPFTAPRGKYSGRALLRSDSQLQDKWGHSFLVSPNYFQLPTISLAAALSPWVAFPVKR